jgi:hypothetical protein
MIKRKEGMCPVKWNPGTWPYTTSFDEPRGHRGDHIDAEGNRIRNLGKAQERSSE